jgi:hypothetical protein
VGSRGRALISVAVTATLGAQDARSDAGETAVVGGVYPCWSTRRPAKIAG